jgi:hypothetical protein
MKLQMKTRPQLGALAIDTHKLTCKQVFQILRAQCEEPNTLFGEHAVRLGFLTERELRNLLAEQAARAMPLVDVLAENDILSAGACEHHYAEYRRCMREATHVQVMA